MLIIASPTVIILVIAVFFGCFGSWLAKIGRGLRNLSMICHFATTFLVFYLVKHGEAWSGSSGEYGMFTVATYLILGIIAIPIVYEAGIMFILKLSGKKEPPNQTIKADEN